MSKEEEVNTEMELPLPNISGIEKIKSSGGSTKSSSSPTIIISDDKIENEDIGPRKNQRPKKQKKLNTNVGYAKTLRRSPRCRDIASSLNMQFERTPPRVKVEKTKTDGMLFNTNETKTLKRVSNSLASLDIEGEQVMAQTPERLRSWKKHQISLKSEKPPLVKRNSALLISKVAEITYDIGEEPTSRQRVIKEIIQTEYDYLRDIEILVGLYIKPLRDAINQRGQSKYKLLLSKKQCRTVFSNIELLFNLNTKFYESLAKEIQKSSDEQLIGNCFLQVGQFLKMYSEYCSNQTTALRYVSLARGTKTPNPNENFDMTKDQISEFSSFCDYTQTCPESRKLDLPSFLIKPVQRVCKYPLLLRELIKSTSQEHPDYTLLQKAFDTISETVHQIDESKVSSFIIFIYFKKLNVCLFCNSRMKLKI